MVDLDAIREGMAAVQAIDPDEAERRVRAIRLAMMRSARKRVRQATKRRAKR